MRRISCNRLLDAQSRTSYIKNFSGMKEHLDLFKEAALFVRHLINTAENLGPTPSDKVKSKAILVIPN